MTIYSYDYGASASNGIGIRAMSPQLGKESIRTDLKDLASLHALESTDHDNEMLSYLLQVDQFTILGLSYIESPKSSGYGRSAPCGLQYVLPTKDMERCNADLGQIINFISFQRPATASPAPLTAFPLNESGYYYHNSPAVLAPLVDSLVRVALSKKQEVLLVALPKGKSSEYAAARYTIAEALSYMPVSLRQQICFFTGLPVDEGETDALTGFDNAVKYKANVIFCPNEYFERLKGYRSFIGLNMEQPGSQAGAFAKYIATKINPAEKLAQIDSCLSGPLTYDSLNKAAQKVERGDVETMDMLKSRLDSSEKKNIEYEQQINDLTQKKIKLQNENDRLKAQMLQEDDVPDAAPQKKTDAPLNRGILQKILLVLCAILLIALAAYAIWIKTSTGFLIPPRETASRVLQEPQETEAVAPTETPALEATPTETKSADESPAAAGEPEEPADDDGETEESADDNENNGDLIFDDTVIETEEIILTDVEPEETAEPVVSEDSEQQEESEETEESDQAEAENTAEASPAPTDPCYALINDEDVSLYSESSDEGTVICQLEKGMRVQLIQTELNDKGEEWAEVIVDEQQGYIMAMYLDMLSPEDSAQPISTPTDMSADGNQ